MIAKIEAWWVWFYGAHIQKTMAYLIGSLVSLDILGLAGPIKSLIGEKGFSGLVIVMAVIVAIRAHAAPTQTYRPDPPTS